MWSLILILLFKSVTASSFVVNDHCTDICRNASLPALELENYEQVVCQRGCGIFNAITFEGDINLNVTKKECYISCEESYIIKEENNVCKMGCNLRASQEIFETNFIVESQESIVLISPDREIEFDLLSDPSIKSQLEVGVDYKIPETIIRTMPIEITEEEITVKESRDWLDCASYNSGIPRWILLSAILSAVLIALWLSFSSEKRSSKEPPIIIDILDDKTIQVETEEADLVRLETSLGIYNGYDVHFSLPPKYSVECEKV